MNALRRWHTVGVRWWWWKYKGIFLFDRCILNRWAGWWWAMGGCSWRYRWNQWRWLKVVILVAPILFLLLKLRHWICARKTCINLNWQCRRCCIGRCQVNLVIKRVIRSQQWQIEIVNTVRCRGWRGVVQQWIQIVDGLLLLVQAGVVRLLICK